MGSNALENAFREEGISGLVLSLLRIRTASRRNPQLREVARFLPNVAASDESRAILLGCTHACSDVSVIEPLPTTAALRAAGIQSVTVAYEGPRQRRTPYSFEELSRRFDFKETMLRTLPRQDLEAMRARFSRAYEILMSGEPQISISELALLQRAQSYSTAGLHVELYGLDTSDE